MATVQQLKERSARLLPPGSEVREAFVCQAASNFSLFVINWMSGLTMYWITYRCVAVTRDAIYILDAPRLSGGAKPRSVVANLPRCTQLGPITGQWGHIALHGERYWVKKRFQSQIIAADADAGFTYQTP